MESVSPALGALITANNYLHDVATGLMLACFVSIWYISRRFDPSTDSGASSLYLTLYSTVTKLARLSLAWILLGGIPRTIYYTRIEWAPSAGETQVATIIVKHIIVFILVGAGIYHWRRFSAQARRVREALR